MKSNAWVSRVWVDSSNTAIIQATDYDANGYASTRLLRIVLDSAGLVGARFNLTEAVMAEPSDALEVVVKRLGNSAGSFELA